VTDETILVRLFDQRFMHTGRQGARRELGKRARKGALARNLAGTLPAAQSPQRGIDGEPLDQARGRRQIQHRLRDKRPRQRMAVFQRTPRQARPHLHERLDPGDIEDNNKSLVRSSQLPDLFPQHREKKALNVIPGVC
jgi:hypothetical protein